MNQIGVDEIEHLLPQNPYDRRAILGDPTEMAKLKLKARKAREAREQQRQAARISQDWWAAIDERIAEHFRGGLSEGGCIAKATGGALAYIRAQVRKEFQTAIDELRDELNAAKNQLHERHARLPMVKSWEPDTVHYLGDVVVCDGSVYQAKRDTGRPVTSDDWILLARAGRDGRAAPMLNFRGVFDVGEKYAKFDVIEYAGGAFVAIRDNPAIIPGEDGWQVLALPGGRGPEGAVGPRGQKGERGERGETLTVVAWTPDPVHYRAVPTLSNGRQGAVLELRGLFEQFLLETRGPS